MKNILPMQTLPDHHVLSGTIDLSRNRRGLWILNLAGLALFLMSGWLLIMLAIAVRAREAERSFTFSVSSLVSLFVPFAWMIGITLVMMVAHEAIHGLFFWIFTGSRPQFGFRGLYAFAAAPNWFLPRRSYLVVALAPVVLITLAGVAAVFLIAEPWLPALLFLVAMNFSGSVGDMMVAVWLLQKPTSDLVQDYGYGVRFYRPAA
jgi:hypothetical protein